jgi:membrane-associated phospholipid phosphatase
MHTLNYKTRGLGFAFLLALSTVAMGAGALPLAGQFTETTPWKLSVGQVSSVFAAISVGLIPTIFGINDELPSCAPCDPATLPGIDRWVVSTERREWGLVSDVAILGLAGGTWYELNQRSNGNAHVAASFEATVWTFGVNQLAKALFNRNRPVLYSEDAVEAQESVNSHRSMYSGHTSGSFAMGTSYYLSMSRKDGFDRAWPLISAATIAGLRLAAAKHFPTDVVVGAVLGTATAILMHQVRF